MVRRREDVCWRRRSGMDPEVVGDGSDEAEQSGAERLQLLVDVDRP